MKLNKKGFSLFELFIVLIIVSLIIGCSLRLHKKMNNSAKIIATKSKMEIIDRALKDYVLKYRKLPCPAGINIKTSSNNFGEEIESNGVCVENSTHGTFKKNSIFVGTIPTKVLNIKKDDIIDGWDNKIIYAVESKFTENIFSENLDKNLSVSFYVDSVSNIIDNVAFVLISNGINQYGAIGRNKNKNNTNKSSNLEVQNLFNKETFTGKVNSIDYNNNKMDDIIKFSTIENVLIEFR